MVLKRQGGEDAKKKKHINLYKRPAEKQQEIIFVCGKLYSQARISLFSAAPTPPHPLLQKSPLGFRELQREGKSAHLGTSLLSRHDHIGAAQSCARTLPASSRAAQRRLHQAVPVATGGPLNTGQSSAFRQLKRRWALEEPCFGQDVSPHSQGLRS